MNLKNPPGLAVPFMQLLYDKNLLTSPSVVISGGEAVVEIWLPLQSAPVFPTPLFLAALIWRLISVGRDYFARSAQQGICTSPENHRITFRNYKINGAAFRLAKDNPGCASVATGNLKFIVLPFPLNIFVLARLLEPDSLACDY